MLLWSADKQPGWFLLSSILYFDTFKDMKKKKSYISYNTEKVFLGNQNPYKY